MARKMEALLCGQFSCVVQRHRRRILAGGLEGEALTRSKSGARLGKFVLEGLDCLQAGTLGLQTAGSLGCIPQRKSSGRRSADDSRHPVLRSPVWLCQRDSDLWHRLALLLSEQCHSAGPSDLVKLSRHSINFAPTLWSCDIPIISCWK